MKLSASVPAFCILIANFLLLYLISNILEQSQISNSADYYKGSFVSACLLYSFAILFTIRYYGIKQSLTVIGIYIAWLYLLKTISVNSKFDITIIQLLIIHFMITILCSISIYCFFLCYSHSHSCSHCKWLIIVILTVVCSIYINLHKLLTINEKIDKWNSYSFKHTVLHQHPCSINIDKNVIPWFDVIPNRFFNFFMGKDYYCVDKNFSFINFETKQLIIHCDIDINEFKIYFGTDYLEKYEKKSIHHFNDKALSNWKHKFIKNISFPHYLIKYNQSSKIHIINILSLSNVLDNNKELITMQCGSSSNAHFIPHNLDLDAQNKNKKQNKNKNQFSLCDPQVPSSILIFVIDATSRHDFHRKLTKSSSILDQINKFGIRHDIYEFFRYNIIGHSTNANLQPLFFDTRLNVSNKRVYNESLTNSLWALAKKSGFLTSLLWDDCKTQYQYNYQYNSSQYAPHHINIVGCDYNFDFYGASNLFQAGKGSIAVNDKCNKQKFVHQHLLEYQTLLWQMNKNKNIFSIIHTVVGHDGVGASVIAIDDYLSKWLEYNILSPSNTNNIFDDTLIILMSDHGMHFGLPKLTQIGNIEHKLGFMTWLYPKNKLNKRIDETLLHNQQSLWTVWDLRKTLLYMFNCNMNHTFKIRASRKNLIMDKISYHRTCRGAWISDIRCSCMIDDSILGISNLDSHA